MQKTLIIYLVSSLILFFYSAWLKYTTFDNYFSFMFAYYNNRFCCMILYNVVFSILISLQNIIVNFIFGQLKQNQRIKIFEKLAYQAFNLIFIVVINSQYLSILTFSIGTGFLILFTLHHLTIQRINYIINSHSLRLYQNYKLLTFFLILLFIDYQILKNTILWLFSYDVISIILVNFMINLTLVGIQPFVKFFIYTYSRFTLVEIQNLDFKLSIINLIINIPRLCILIVIQLWIFYKFRLNLIFLISFIGPCKEIIQIIKGFKNMIKLTQKMDTLKKVTKQEIQKTQDNTCMICFSHMEQGRILQCGHIFHFECLRQWIQKNINHFCPKCKRKFNFEENNEKKQQFRKQKNITEQFNNNEIKMQQNNRNQQIKYESINIIQQKLAQELDFSLNHYQQIIQQQFIKKNSKKTTKKKLGSLPFCPPTEAVYRRDKKSMIKRNNIIKFNSNLLTLLNFKKQLQMLILQQ